VVPKKEKGGNDMNILVTGGTGALGARVGEKLLENGLKPILFDLAPQPKQIEKIKDKCELIRGDILEFPELLKVIKDKKVEGIIHTAGILTSGALQRPYSAIKVNIDGTLNILEAARIESVPKVVFCSSATVYNFAVHRDRPVTESHPTFPKSIYASSKLSCEYLGRNYSDLYGIKFISLRFASLYGPGYSQSGIAGLWIHPLLTALMLGHAYKIKRPSRKVNEYIYSPDAGSALVKAVQKETRSNIFNIGEGRLRAFEEIINLVQKEFPSQQIEIIEGTGKDTQYAERAHAYDISLAKKELEFKVDFSLENAIPHYVQCLRNQLRNIIKS
jgi:nucleoside-diphosphate-sugar epimerase